MKIKESQTMQRGLKMGKFIMKVVREDRVRKTAFYVKGKGFVFTEDLTDNADIVMSNASPKMRQAIKDFESLGFVAECRYL